MPRQYRDEPDQQLPASAGNGHRPRANGDAIPPRTREGDAGEARFDRGARLALAITGAWVAGLLALTLAVLQYPSDGWSSARRGQRYVVELPLTGAPSPLRAGDVVVAIDGRPLAPRRLPPLPPRPRVGQVLRYSVQRDGRTVEADVALVRPGPVGAARGVLARLRRDPRDPVGALASFAVVAWAFARRPRNPGARYLLLAFGYYFAVQWCGSALPGLYAGTWPPAAALAAELVAASWAWFFFPSLALLALAFPVVKAPLRRLPRLLPGLLYGAPLALSAAAAWSAVAARGYALADALLLPAFLGALALAVAALLGTLAHNWRTVREPVARAQLRWVALGLGAGLGLPFTLMLLAAGFTGDFAPVAPALWLTLLVPLALAVAIARYRLWDLDLLVNRALVYGALTACVAGLYALVVGRLGALVGGRGETWPHLLAAGLVAALFGPLRARLQRGVNRLLYGDRDEPYAALARLGRQLGAPLAPDALPGAIVTTVREALRLPYAAIVPPAARGTGVLVAAGDPAATAAPGLLRLPLAPRGEAVGALLLAPRAPGEGFSAADRRLLGDLARQAGVAVRAAGLHADLLRARQRLVAAREGGGGCGATCTTGWGPSSPRSPSRPRRRATSWGATPPAPTPSWRRWPTRPRGRSPTSAASSTPCARPPSTSWGSPARCGSTPRGPSACGSRSRRPRRCRPSRPRWRWRPIASPWRRSPTRRGTRWARRAPSCGSRLRAPRCRSRSPTTGSACPRRGRPVSAWRRCASARRSWAAR